MALRLENSPAGWLVLVLGYVAVAILGYIDCLAGDYAMLIFYMIPVCFVAWFLGRFGAVLISTAAGLVRLISEYLSAAPTTFRFWGSLQDMSFLLMIGLVVAVIRRMMTEADDHE